MIPKSADLSGKVELSGGWQTVRGLTIAEIREIRKIEDTTESDCLAIAYATMEPLEDVREWFAGAVAGDVVRLLDAIHKISGMDEAAGFPGRTGNDAGVPAATDNGQHGSVLPSAPAG